MNTPQFTITLADTPLGYAVTPADPALSAALDAIRSWGSPAKLVDFAQARHGYGNSDGMCGITYPGDLDDYDRTVLGENIPEGFVESYAWAGAGHGPTYLIAEAAYIELLRQYLVLLGEDDLAQALISSAQTSKSSKSASDTQK